MADRSRGRGGTLRLVCAVLFCLLPCTTQARGAEAAGASLERAWQEYGFQAFGNARKLFVEAGEAADADAEQRLQARLGLAFITHFQMPGRDPQAAIPLYESLLDEAPDEPGWKVLLLARLGDCHAEIGPPQLTEARRFYRRALEAAPDTSLMVQETILRLLTTYLREPDPEVYARGLAAAGEFAGQMRGAHFESIYYGLQSELAFFGGDMARMAEALAAQYRTGINNVKVKEKVLFQLARVYEVELRDFVQAEHYYRKLASEVPSSIKAHFALLRADELRAGKIQSDYAPALAPLGQGPPADDASGEEGGHGR